MRQCPADFVANVAEAANCDEREDKEVTSPRTEDRGLLLVLDGEA